MAQPTGTERQALVESDSLLRFAAEKVNNLDPSLSLAIAKSHGAAESDTWTPEVSQEFWTAFAKLCDLVQPVTVDTLTATDRTLEPAKWMNWRFKGKISLAERSSARYLVLLFALLAITIPLQLYVWTCTNLSKEIADIYNINQTIITKNADTFRNLVAATTPASADQSHTYTKDELNAVTSLNAVRGDIQSNLSRALVETRLLQIISTFHTDISLDTPEKKMVNPDDWYSNYSAALNQHNADQAKSQAIQAEASVIVGILLSFIMPVLFGTIGAVAFVIRAISDQIKNSTFSKTSPVRHLLRVGLGALAGVVVGLFNGLSTQLSLPPLAIAFLAGYGVEGLFSMFDGFIAKFRA